MNRSKIGACAASVVVAMLVGCGATSSPGTTTGGAPAGGSESKGSSDANEAQCGAKREEALDIVKAAIDANMACTQDGDCTLVGFGAGCVDACSRPMATSGKDAYEKAVAQANATSCSDYAKMTCAPIMHPPCAPNPPPTCKEGKCG